ncbi:T9SS type A sorting domain-containing protein [Algibacter sp. 2305UL17-15]|uniref:T9SS type A sorting domain-containing protein n=1 Tax=Algibacter sp. 2305UL17-15 TaxID=3231268 RepID=UPI00345986C1
MKKITLLLLLFTAYFGYAQPTTDPATPPMRNAGDVISIFSGEYTDVAGSDFNPNWGQSGFGTANTAFDTGSGNIVLAYPNFNYQGVQYGSPQNISAMEFLHVDIYITSAMNPNVYVISSGAEIAHPITNTGANTWISVDIPVSGITGDTTNAIQFKFDGGNGTTDAIYVDNLYFWKAAVDPATDATLSDLQIDNVQIPGFGPGTTTYNYAVAPGTVVVPQITLATTTNAGATRIINQATSIPGTATVDVTASNGTDMQTYTVNIFASGPPTAAPTPPARAAADVKSIFSDAYTDIAVDTYDTPWCPGTTTEESIGGDAVKKVSGLGCEGVEFLTGRFDATAFTHFHMDIFTETATMDKSFNVKFSNWNGGGGEANAIEYSATNANILPNPNPGTWISIDLPLSSFTAGSRNDLVQFIISSDLGTVYYDNLYLYKGNPLSNDDFNKTAFTAYPNPTQDNWTVKGQDAKIETINVFDILGKQVLRLSPNNREALIDGSSLKSGIYFAHIKTLTGINSVKLIKQ